MMIRADSTLDNTVDPDIGRTTVSGLVDADAALLLACPLRWSTPSGSSGSARRTPGR